MEYTVIKKKKEWNIAICSNKYEPRDYHMDWSQKEKDKYRMMSLTYGI